VTRMPQPTSRRAVLGLGSNQGDRLATLQGAVDALAATPGVNPVAVSGIFETDPVGGPEQPDYLNAVLVVETTLQAPELLERAHAIEQQHDRVRSERWGPRTLDIDLVAVGTDVIDDPDLVIPHPRAAQRAFVLVPWASADPEASLPGHGPVADLLAGLDASGVRARPDLVLRLGPAT
jgi:2-amino-4-hydroxy-6-hydroxymethyldihydropteridine diphosphokinase